MQEKTGIAFEDYYCAACAAVAAPSYTRTHPPSGVFRGNNFMTPVLVTYLRTTLGGRTVYVEVSSERPPYWERSVERKPNPQPLVGLTYRHADGSNLDPDPSGVHRGFEAAAAALGVPVSTLEATP